MKKHKYPPSIVEAIIADEQYWVEFFTKYAVVAQDRKYIPKQRTNGDLTMRCPIHMDNTPSFRVNVKNNIFKCFGCGKSGTFLNFLEIVYEQSFFQSIEMALALRNPTPLPFRDPNQLRIAFPKKVQENTSEELPDDDLPF